MKVNLLQMAPEWLNVKANVQQAERLMAAASEADLYVLPEMWATGFTAPEIVGVKPDNLAPAAEALQRWAANRACHVMGSLPIFDGQAWYNRLLHFGPDGLVDYYDKHHLFLGFEQQHFRPGARRVVTTINGWRILLLICFDLRFPVFIRSHNDYDAIVCVASWPAARQTAWQTLLAARAIENQCYMLGVNRTGSDPQANYAGGTAVYDPAGVNLCPDLQRTEAVVHVEISLEALQRLRKSFCVARSADAFTLHL